MQCMPCERRTRKKSHSLWVRGLKYFDYSIACTIIVSHSLWVRGLKSRRNNKDEADFMSHSLWVRGLKFKRDISFTSFYTVALFVSAWIEIQSNKWKKLSVKSRTLCECVDWNKASILSISRYLKSHSLWVRGLKYGYRPYWYLYWRSRTLCECVDWNITFDWKKTSVTRSHSLWVRGLK